MARLPSFNVAQSMRMDFVMTPQTSKSALLGDFDIGIGVFRLHREWLHCARLPRRLGPGPGSNALRRRSRSRKCQRMYSTAAAVDRRAGADVNHGTKRDRRRINRSGHRERREWLTALGIIGFQGEGIHAERQL